MKSNLTAAIAWRWLLSKKTHGAVGTITTVSICAMAIATAAIICVLSVFNGFRSVISSKLDSLSPDVMVTPSEGKTFANAEALALDIQKLAEVEIATPTLSDNALAIFNSQEMPVTLKGVIIDEYAKVTSIKSLIEKDYGNYFSDNRPDNLPAEAILAIGTASRLRAYPEAQMMIFAPRRHGRVNLANPAASFITDSIYVAGIYRSDQQQFDEDGIIMPIEKVRSLLQHDTEASAIEIKVHSGVSTEAAAKAIANKLGNNYIVKDRARQQEMNFRMVEIEKWVSYLLLAFILTIASFNIISSLSMLVLEKENSIGILSSLGMTRRKIGRIFAWESIYVSMAGGLSGLMLGLILCFLQQEFGLISIGSDPEMSIVTAYPVKIIPSDIPATLAPVIIIGLVTALLTAAFARSKARQI